MFGLETLADRFDRFHAVWDTAVDLALTDHVDDYNKVWGPDDWRTQGVAVQAGLIWALNAFAGGMLKGYANVARLGEGIKTGSFGGIAEDGLRLLTFAGPAMQVVRRGGAMLIAGNQVSNSCVMTSNAFALRLSATRIGITIDGLARAGGMPPPTTTAAYTGHMAVDIAKALKAVGARVLPHTFRTTAKIEEVERLVRTNRGPVVFTVDWIETPGFAPVSAHAMTAFRDLFGRIMVADQTGIRPLLKLGEFESGVVPLINIVVREAYTIENALMLRSANALSAVPGVASAAQVAVEAFHLPGPSFVAFDDAIRVALHRPTRAQEVEEQRKKKRAAGAGATPAAGAGATPAAGAPSTPGAPKLPPVGTTPAAGVPLTPDALKLLAVIPAKGEITSQAARAQSGLDATRFQAAVKSLEAARKVVVRRAAHDTLTINGIRRP